MYSSGLVETKVKSKIKIISLSTWHNLTKFKKFSKICQINKLSKLSWFSLR